MPFDLSSDFGRGEKHQFEFLDRYCHSVENTILWFEEWIAHYNKELEKGKTKNLAQDLESIHYDEFCVGRLKSLLSRAEKLRRDTNTFYRKNQEEHEHREALIQRAIYGHGVAGEE